MSAAAKRRGPRSSYIGTEVFLSLVDPAQAPFSGDLRQLSIQTLCTNRDLVLQMPIGVGTSDLSLDVAAPVDEHPRRERPEPSVRAAGRRRGVVARDQSPVAQLPVARRSRRRRKGRAALRDLLELYAASADVSARRQIEGIRSVRVGRVVRRLRGAGSARLRPRPRDHRAASTSWRSRARAPSCSASVLDRYFARHVSINSFTETVLRSENRGEINRWGPQWGARPTL